MAGLDVLRPEQHTEWQSVVTQAFQHDFYHLPTYHALAEERGEGEAHLFVYREGEHSVAIPLLLRPIGEVLCHAHKGQEWLDATCVYGYAGPIGSSLDIPDSVLSGFRSALRETLESSAVVAVFSRLHPLISQRALLADLGECVPIGQTVSIDLTLPIEVQRAQYRKDYKRQINRLKRLGATCFRDPSRAHLDEFIEMYHESMRRVQAEDDYYFDRAYFEGLLAALGADIHLFLCSMNNEIVCGGLFALCDGIVQAHLVGSRDEYLKLSPIKLLFDTVRLWANEHGARALHLGGGVGAQTDSVFHFKAGFSKRRHEFVIWKWVILPDVYRELCEEKEQWGRQHGLDMGRAEYFPAYRCASCPGVSCDQFKSGRGVQ